MKMIFTLPECLTSLDSIAEQHDINILYACESGSRAWGIQSINSDYDIRFIYHRPIDQYLKLTPRKDTILHLEGDLDLVGWDLLKTCQLAAKSNPSIIEWLNSPIIYYEYSPFTETLRKIMNNYSPRALMYHYVNLSHNQVKEYWKKGEDVTYKKYFYAIRPLFATIWMKDNNYNVPPLKFLELFRKVQVNSSIKKAILDLLALKAQGKETSKGRWKVLDQFIMDHIPICREYAKNAYTNEPNRTELESLFQFYALILPYPKGVPWPLPLEKSKLELA